MGFLNFFVRTPPSSRERIVSQEKSFTQELHSAIERNAYFSVVMVQIDKGDLDYVHEQIGGTKASTRTLGFVLPPRKTYAVHAALEKLAASCELQVRVGCTIYNPMERKLVYVSPLATKPKLPEYTHISPGDLVARVQRSYVHMNYGKKEQSVSVGSALPA